MCTLGVKGYTAVRTNIVIDDKLMRDTLRATGLKTKREAVELALQTLLRLRKQSEIRRWRRQAEMARRPRRDAERRLILVRTRMVARLHQRISPT